jgi:hypothetical protein
VSPPFDIRSFIVQGDLRRLLEKKAFTPSPAVAQLAMADAQGAPPGGGAPGGPPGAPPGGLSPGPGGPPPGMDPAAMGGAPPSGPPGPSPGPLPASPVPGGPTDLGAGPGGPPDPIVQLTQQNQQILQLLQQNQAGGAGGAGGIPGKPNTASVKFEPAHFHEMKHDISNMKSILVQMADAMGLQIPASKLMHQPPPAPSSTPAPPSPAPPSPTGSDTSGAGPAGAPPGAAPLAVQLPALPPVAAKAAKIASIPSPDALRIDSRLDTGRAITAPPEAPGAFAVVANILARVRSA